MKKLLLFVGLLWSAVASAQFTPGQVLTAAQLNSTFALYAPLTGATFTGPVSLPAGSSVNGYLTAASAASIYAPLASPVFTGSPVVPGYLTTASASSTYAPIASPTFTGTVTVPTGFNVTNLAGQANFNINGATGNSRQFQFQTAGSNRWTIATNQTAEAGGNLGSDFGIYNFDNTGTYLSNPLLIYRNSGQAYFTVRPVFNGNTPYDTGNLTIANYALLASPTFTGTVTTAALTSTGTITPSQTAGIVGTTTNNNANAGSIGEYVVNSATSVALTNATPLNITSISLTAGDWDVSGLASVAAAASTTVQNAFAGSSSTSATIGPYGSYWNSFVGQSITAAAASYAIPTVRYSLAATTTIYCVENISFLVSTATGSCLLRARRIR